MRFDETELRVCQEELRLKELALEQICRRAREHWERLIAMEGTNSALFRRAAKAYRARPLPKYFLEVVQAEPTGAHVSGWAYVPGIPSESCQTYVVLTGGWEPQFFKAERVERPDVAEYFSDPALRSCGFRVFCPRNFLEEELYWIGLFLDGGDQGSGYTPTDRYVRFP